MVSKCNQSNDISKNVIWYHTVSQYHGICKNVIWYQNATNQTIYVKM